MAATKVMRWRLPTSRQAQCPSGEPPETDGSHGGFIQCAFTSVIVGVAETAVEAARQHVARRRDTLRAYERVEWARAEMEGWLIQQAYDGMLRAVEDGKDGRRRAAQAKTAIAELAESATARICRVIGGERSRGPHPSATGTKMSARLALRPPWALVYDNLFEWSCALPGSVMRHPSDTVSPNNMVERTGPERPATHHERWASKKR
jgi:hypothetical protein